MAKQATENKKMRVFIVEDEFVAQAGLRRMIALHFEDLEVVGTADSVKSAVAWLKHNHADVIFMDVELSDGTCFEIFKQVTVTAKVIITTAYDSYALRAFRVNSVDYLLKPLDLEQVAQAIVRCRQQTVTTETSVFGNPAQEPSDFRQNYKQRFIVRLGDRIIIIRTSDISCFLSKEKTVYLVTREGKRYIMDQSLDMIESSLDPSLFFRIARACIVNINAIAGMTRHFSGRLRLSLTPQLGEDIFVSRVRTQDFMRWINQ